MIRKMLLLTFALACATEAQSEPRGGSEMIQSLADCGNLADDAAQLACYRRTSAALVKAEAEGEVVIVDREKARQVRRQAFGLSLPSLSLFDKGAPDDERDTLVAQVRAARQDPTGRWILQLDGGATWRQVEATPLGLPPKPGMQVTISRAALGSYNMRIGNQTAVKARRIE